MTDKIKFPKRTRKVWLAKDLEMEDYPDVWFEIWDDPNKRVFAQIWSGIYLDYDDTEIEEQREILDTFFEAIASVLIDTNVDGLSFDTKDDAIESFSHPDLPWGFMYDIVGKVIANIMSESERIKKAFAVLFASTDSGNDNDKKEDQSAT